MPALTDPQLETFAQHYATYRTVKKAHEAAKLPDNVQPGAILRQKEVAGRVRELWGMAMAAAGVTAESVMNQLRLMAYQDIRDLYNSDGMLKPVHELDDETAATITGIEVETRFERDGYDEDGKQKISPVITTKVKRVNPMEALSIFAKHFKLVGDDGDQVNALASTLIERLDAARRRTFAAQTANEVEDARIIPPRQVTDSGPASVGVFSVSPSRPAAPATMESNDDELW